jgi:predicted dehydrogenase
MVRLGLVGCGWILWTGYVPNLASDQGRSAFTTTAACDPDAHARSRVAQAFDGICAGATLAEIADACDAFLICTPNETHVNLAQEALALGKPCLIEKPVAVCTDDVNRLRSEAARRRIPLVQAAVCRHRDDVLAWASMLPAIGSIVRLTFRWRRHGGVPNINSRGLDDSNGWYGVVPDLGYHLADLCGMVLGWPADLEIVRRHRSSRGRSAVATWHRSEFAADGEVTYGAADDVQLSCRIAGVAVDFDVSWVDDIHGDITQLIAEGTSGTVSLEGLFGFSQNRRVPYQHVIRTSADGQLCEAAEFVPGGNLHRRAFGGVLDDFSRRLGSADSDMTLKDVAFCARLMEAARQP